MKQLERYLTPAEDAAFENYLHDWAKQLSLADWCFYRGVGKPKNAQADIKPTMHARYARFRTGNWTHIEPTEEELSRIALHEALHVFLAELIDAAEGDSVERLASVEHRVINTLTKLLTQQEHQ